MTIRFTAHSGFDGAPQIGAASIPGQAVIKNSNQGGMQILLTRVTGR